MARDIDAVKIAGIHETRGRQSKAIRARTRTDTLKGFEATAKGLTRSLDFALPLGLFAATVWFSRMKIVAVAGDVTIGLFSPDRLVSVTARPTYQGRPVAELHFHHPELFAVEGMGALTILMSMPGSDLIGLVENGLALGLYHIFLNGGSSLIPRGTFTLGPLDPFATLWKLTIGSFVLPTTPTSTTSWEFRGMFPSFKKLLGDMQADLQAEIDAGRMTLPTATIGGPTHVPVDTIVRRLQLDSVIKSLAHGAFLTLLLKRGGGVVPTE